MLQKTLANKEAGPGLRRIKTKAQVTLELTLGIIAVFMLIFACMRLLFWFTHSMVDRQKAFQGSRGGTSTDFYTPEKLIIVK